MKNISITLALLFIALILNAQEATRSNDEISTLFGKNKDTKLGWFVGFDNSYTQFGSRDVHMSGFNAGLIINHSFAVGFSGSGWTNRNSMYYNHVTDTSGAYLEGGFGRMLFEITPFPQSPLHITFPILLGGGGASYITEEDYFEWDEDDWDNYHKNLDTDLFFSFEPGIRAELNVFRFMRLNAGVSYRYVSGLELMNTPSDLMNNLSATVGLKFGKF
ncbi:MAG: hypothetical protein IPH84_14055 [Bacteroidales bacterium]|nr:hypothetical protein [Bacteroidales bacterium]